MNKKISRILRTNITLFSLCLVAFVIAAIPVSPVLALAEAVVVVLVFLLSRRNSASAQQSVRQYMQRYNGGMDSARSANTLYAPMGMVVFDFDTKVILWANDNFLTLAGKDEGVFETPIDEVVPKFPVHWLVEGKSCTKGENHAILQANRRISAFFLVCFPAAQPVRVG